MPALPAGPGEGRGFVVGVAGSGQARLDRVLHVGAGVGRGQFGREGGEARVRLERQLVAGQVGRRKGECGLDIGQRFGLRLPGQAVHQIEVEALEMFGGERRRDPRLGAAVDAPEGREMAVVEALDPERQAIDAGGAEAGELRRFDRSRVGLERDLGIGRQHGQGANGGEQFVDRIG